MLGNIILIIFLLFAIFLYNQPLEYKPRVIFLDVGQGDAIFLIDSSGKKILIDGGGGDYVVYNISKYLHPKDRVIDYVILTHPHEDHLSGLIDIFERYEVKSILFYPVCYSSTLYQHFLYLDENIVKIEKDFLFEGESFSLKILYPLENWGNDCIKINNINNSSIITKLEANSGSILFMGDTEHEIENWLLKNYRREDLKSDILKVGHHCSRTASSQKFLEIVRPIYAICSVGKENKFGHPHREVIENFKKLGIEYVLTSEIGDVVIEL